MHLGPRILVLLLSMWLLGCGRGAFRPPPIILVSMDTMRPDRLGAWGSKEPLSPNLDRFASQSIVFEQAYAQANETLFSHASLFTSRYASELGRLTYSFRLPTDVPTLAQVLGLYGYRTMASVAGGHLAADFGFDRGFELYATSKDWGSLQHTIPPALAWLDTLGSDEPFFLFLHGYDCHFRYLKPSPFGLIRARSRGRPLSMELATRDMASAEVLDGFYLQGRSPQQIWDFTENRIWGPEARARIRALAEDPSERITQLAPDDQAFLRSVYDGAVVYADTMFGLLLAELGARGILDRAVIAVVSDHGEELGENGLYNHRFTMSDEALHVVMMVRMPGGRNGGRHVLDLAGLLDVMPTLLELGGAAPPAGMEGRSLVGSIDGQALPPRQALFSEGAFRLISARTLTARLTFSGVSVESPYLVPLLSSSRLDGPAFEVKPAGSAETAGLRDALVAWRQGLHPIAQAAEGTNPSLLEALHEHGYWEAD
jgi:hypothetical protein